MPRLARQSSGSQGRTSPLPKRPASSGPGPGHVGPRRITLEHAWRPPPHDPDRPVMYGRKLQYLQPELTRNDGSGSPPGPPNSSEKPHIISSRSFPSCRSLCGRALKKRCFMLAIRDRRTGAVGWFSEITNAPSSWDASTMSRLAAKDVRRRRLAPCGARRRLGSPTMPMLTGGGRQPRRG